MTSKTTTNLMITKVVEKFGTSSSEATLMRFMVRSYITHNRTYDEVYDTYKKLIKKKIKG